MSSRNLTPHTPEAINKAVAEHVADWKRHDESYPFPASANGICKRIVWRDTSGNAMATADELIPDFYHSADAVLPLLEKYSVSVERVCFEDDWSVVLSDGMAEDDDDRTYHASAPTFAAAACLALLRAAGITVEEEKK